MTAADVVERLTAAGKGSEDLDDLVHDLASGVASDVNNEGLESQVEWLLEHGMTGEQIVKQAG